ncbi:hypothetical protein B0H11DRAFT_1914487 [Mycena galericulata]|nr:hypothetical protein B0H11DRAFT_1914487 [Mycena galericulata]
MSELSAPEETPPVRFHLNPWVATPPQSVIVEGISCTGTKQFPVDSVPSTYPYPPYLASTVPNVKPKIPYFIFSGPNPPPADIGYPGDIYVAPAAKALYAYLPADGVPGGAWTRWTAVVSDARAVQSGDGLLAHPYIPDRFLWTKNSTASFSWLTLDNIQDSLRNQINPAGRERLTEAAAETLVERTLWDAQERQKSKKRPAGDPEQPRKKARAKRIFFSRATSTNPWEEPAGSELYPSSSMQATTQLQKQAAALVESKAENEELRTKLENAERVSQNQIAIIARLEAEYQELETQVQSEWQLRPPQMVTVGCLESRTETQELHNRAATTQRVSKLTGAETRITQLEATLVQGMYALIPIHFCRVSNPLAKAQRESASLSTQHNDALRAAQTLNSTLRAEFEPIKTAAAQDAASLKLATDHISWVQTTILQRDAEIRFLEQSRREDASLHHDLLQRIESERNDALAHNAEATRKLESLTSEIERLKRAAEDDASARRLAEVGATDAQGKISVLEKEIGRLKQASRREADVLKTLLAAHEAEN